MITIGHVRLAMPGRPEGHQRPPFPAGGHSIWHVPHEVKKLAICRQHMPAPFGFALRAWNKLAAILRGPAEQGGQLDGEAAGGAVAEHAAAV